MKNITKNKELTEEREGHDTHGNKEERGKGDFQDDDEGNYRMTAVRRPREQQVQI